MTPTKEKVTMQLRLQVPEQLSGKSQQQLEALAFEALVVRLYALGELSSGEGAKLLNLTGRAASMSLLLHYTAHKVWKRLRLKAKQTRHHSPAAASSPRKENWRKPSTSLMMPITGSTVHLRAP